MSLRDDLDAVPWADLRHAYGPATDTPDALLQLLSEDAETREMVLEEQLWPSICHQGSVYEASCAAVPFLIRILREGPPAGREEILRLLAGLASCEVYAKRGTRILQVKRRFVEGSKMESAHEWWSPDAFLRDGGKYYDPHVIARAHVLVAAGLPDYLALIEEDGADPELICATLYLLSGFGEVVERIMPTFEALLSEASLGRAKDVRVEAEALFCLGALLPAGAPGWERHVGLLARSDPPARPAARYAAAAALATYHPTALPPEGVDTLIEAMITPDDLDEFSLRFVDTSVIHDAYLLLGGLGAPAGTDALTLALARGVKRWHILNTFLIAEALLDTAFFGAPVRDRYHSVSTAFLPLNSDSQLPGHLDWFFGQHSSGFPNPDYDIDYGGYAEEEAQRIRERVTRDGAATFSADERLALKAVVACEPLWLLSHNLLDIYGLPRERDALAALLAGAN